MILLAVESSCDETAVALVQDGRTVLADCIASSVEMHKIYGGVVPEIASRKHIEVISQLADQALVKAGLTRKDIDAVAVTYAPGLIGAVLVGVSFAKSVAYALGVPLIPVHHVRGHIAANYIAHPDLEPPFVCLCVSGGTSLICACNGRFYGGGFNPIPDSMPDNGKLEFLVVRDVSRLTFIRLVGKYAKGRYRELEQYITHLEGDHLEIDSENEIVVNIDGEALYGKHVNFDLIPGGVNFLVPANMAFFHPETAGGHETREFVHT